MSEKQEYARRFTAGLELLLPGASCLEQARLFDGRANRHDVRNWRIGNATAPPWAVERLRQLLEARGQQYGAIAESVAAIPVRGHGSHGNIIAWNKKRAAEKAALNAKREAGND